MGKYGKDQGEKLALRLQQIKAAETLEIFQKSVPAARCHELTGERDGQLAIHLVHPFRLVFRPNHETVPKKEDGGLDWSKVTKIVIEEIVDYH